MADTNTAPVGGWSVTCTPADGLGPAFASVSRNVVAPVASGPEIRCFVSDTSASGCTVTVADASSSSVVEPLAGVESGSAASDRVISALLVAVSAVTVATRSRVTEAFAATSPTDQMPVFSS